MAKYRSRLPQLSDRLFLTDSGHGNVLIFHEGVELPYFASFDLMKNDAGIARYAAITSATSRWRASAGSASCSKAHLARKSRLGREARLSQRRAGANQPAHDRVDGGAARPARDGANADLIWAISGRAATAKPGAHMSAKEAHDYHASRSR